MHGSFFVSGLLSSGGVVRVRQLTRQ